MFKHFVSFKTSRLNQCLLKAAEVGVQEMIFIYVFCNRLRLDRLISLSWVSSLELIIIEELN